MSTRRAYLDQGIGETRGVIMLDGRPDERRCALSSSGTTSPGFIRCRFSAATRLARSRARPTATRSAGSAMRTRASVPRKATRPPRTPNSITRHRHAAAKGAGARNRTGASQRTGKSPAPPRARTIRFRIPDKFKFLPGTSRSRAAVLQNLLCHRTIDWA